MENNYASRFIFLEELMELSGYTDMRSIRRWLTEMNLPLMRLGKRYAVSKDEFEKALKRKFSLAEQAVAYKPTLPSEKEFLAELKTYLEKH